MKKLVSIWHGAIYAEYQKRYLELARLGWDVTLIVPEEWTYGLSSPAKLERLQSDKFKIIALQVAFQFHGATFFYKGINKVLTEIQPDVIECIEEPFSFAAWRILRWKNKNLPQAKFIISTCQNLYKKYPPPFRWFESYVLKHSDGLHGLNAESLEVFKRKGYNGPAIVLPTGIDPEVFKPPEDESQNQRKWIGYIGRLVPDKGIDLLLLAYCDPNELYKMGKIFTSKDLTHHKLNQDLLEKHFRIAIAGEGPNKDLLKSLATELNIEDNIEWLGTVPHSEVVNFYQQCIALVLPSKTMPHWKEQLGRVLIEAMACGAIPIGSSSGEIPNVIGDAGLVFEEDNITDLREKLLSLIGNEDQIQKLKESGVDRVQQNYSWNAISNRLNDFIKSI